MKKKIKQPQLHPTAILPLPIRKFPPLVVIWVIPKEFVWQQDPGRTSIGSKIFLCLGFSEVAKWQQ